MLEKWLTDFISAADISLGRMAKDILTLGKQNVPYDTGALQSSGRIDKTSKGHYKISFGKTKAQDYAAIQENTQFVNYTVPGTGPHYLRDAANRIGAYSSNYFKRQ